MTDHLPTPTPGTAIGRLRLTIAGRPVELTFPDSADMRQSLQRIMAGEEYRIPRLMGYSPAVIIDIGANVGASALFFHAGYPDAQVYCYEPSPTNFAFLQQNLAFSNRFHVFPYGLLDRDGEVRLYVGRHQWMQNSVIPNNETGDAFEWVTLRRAGAELTERGLVDVSILKLDTEGCEVPILEDLRPWLPRLDFLYLEYHCEQDRRAMDRLLEPDFVVFAACATRAHRGTVAYVSNGMASRFPVFNARRIESPPQAAEG